MSQLRALSKSKQRGKLVNKKVLSAILCAFLKATLLQWEGETVKQLEGDIWHGGSDRQV